VLIVEYDFDEEANTVPYPPLFDYVRKNNGFVDLRGRPDLAGKVMEGERSPALRALLMQLASPQSQLWTLGCDLGETETKLDAGRRFAAGGYIQWVLSSPADSDTSSYDTLGSDVTAAVEPVSGDNIWSLTILGKYVDLKLDHEYGLVPSHWIWFDAFAATPNGARSSREALITAVGTAITSNVSANP
jgi:hypothetical protein